MAYVKVILCTSVLVLACQVYGRPQQNAAASAPTTKSGGNVTFVKNDVIPLDGKGSFSYDIELSDGTKLAQSGHTIAPGMGETEPSIVLEGSYAYVAPDGKQVSITYIADKNGFQPKGDVIPTQGPAQPAAQPAASSAGSSGSLPAAAPVPQAASASASAGATAAP